MRTRTARMMSLALFATALLVAIGVGSANAACGQADTCASGRLCLYPTEDFSGSTIKTVVCSVPTLDYDGCNNSCDCLCWNTLTKSVWNNSSWTYRLFNATNYPTGPTNHFDLSPGASLTCAQMGSSFCSDSNHVQSEKNLSICTDTCDPGCPPGCGACS